MQVIIIILFTTKHMFLILDKSTKITFQSSFSIFIFTLSITELLMGSNCFLQKYLASIDNSNFQYTLIAIILLISFGFYFLLRHNLLPTCLFIFIGSIFYPEILLWCVRKVFKVHVKTGYTGFLPLQN